VIQATNLSVCMELHVAVKLQSNSLHAT